MAGQSTPERPLFYFDLGSPYAYLAAERISGLFSEAELEQPEWRPILLGGLFRRFGRDSWANGPGRAAGMAEVERRASSYGLPPVRWPNPWPGNTLLAMRAATFAKQTGRTVSFSLAAFRQAFAAGLDLSEPRRRVHRSRRLRAASEGAAEGDRDRRREGGAAGGDRGGRGPRCARSSEPAGRRQVFWGDDLLEQGAAAAARAA